MNNTERCSAMPTALMTCDAKAVVEIEGKWFCRKCASMEKGVLEETANALKRASAKVKAKLRKLKDIKATPYAGSYRIALRSDGLEDDV